MIISGLIMTPQKLIDMKIGFKREIFNDSKIHRRSLGKAVYRFEMNDRNLIKATNICWQSAMCWSYLLVGIQILKFSIKYIFCYVFCDNDMTKSPDFINWTVYRMTYNDKDAYKRRKIVLQHIREHASVFR